MSAIAFILAATLWQIAAPQQAFDPSTLAAKDQHQGFLVAAIPFSDAAAAKTELDKADPIKAGILPVEVYFRNNTTEPVRVDLNTIRLDIDAPDGQKLHLQAMSLDQAASAIAHPKGASAPSGRRFPPIIATPIHDSKQIDAAKKLQPVMFQTDVVPPGSTVHGFMFFDLNHDFELLPDATLYVPDVKSVASSEAMIYFEIPLKVRDSH